MGEPLVDWALQLARGHLGGLDQRWRHTLGVAHRATEFSHLLPPSELDVLVSAAYLHDIGYAPELAVTGFHPLDGARYVRALGHERLACLIAFHSGARAEADQRGFAAELAEFDEEASLVACALTYCDLVTGSDGRRVQLSERLGELFERYGPDTPVARAARRSAAEFCAIVQVVEEILTRACAATGARSPDVLADEQERASSVHCGEYAAERSGESECHVVRSRGEHMFDTYSTGVSLSDPNRIATHG
ncbi:MAG: HD domain-containing protein [Nitriliruptorales bacterium]